MEFQSEEVDNLLKEYSDAGQASAWARESMAACAKAGTVSGKGGKTMAPGMKSLEPR